MKHTQVVRSHKQAIAGLRGVTEDYVSKVVRGIRRNEQILADYMMLVQEEKSAVRKLATMKAMLNGQLSMVNGEIQMKQKREAKKREHASMVN